jgi:hypothetical protein
VATVPLDRLIIREIADVLSPVVTLEEPASAAKLLRALGWDFAATTVPGINLGSLRTDVQQMVESAAALAGASGDAIEEAYFQLAADIIKVVVGMRQTVPQIVAVVQALPQVHGPSGDVFLRRLLDYLIYEYLAAKHQGTFAILHLLGLLERDAARLETRVIWWDRISLLFTDPLDLAERAYKWQSGFEGEQFLERLSLVMHAFRLAGGLYRQSPIIRNALGRPIDAQELRFPLLHGGRWPESYFEFDLNTSPVPTGTGWPQGGLLLYPALAGAIDLSTGDYAVRVRGAADFAAGMGIEVRPPHDLRLKTALLSSAPAESTNARLEIDVALGAADRPLTYIFGSEDGSHLAVRAMGLKGLVSVEAGTTEIAFEIEIRELTLTITGDGSDGFIQRVLAGVNVETVADLTIGYSSRNGVYFRGSGALEVRIPIHRNIGPLRLDTVLIGLGLSDGFLLTLAVSFSAEIGPVAAAVKEIGLEIPIAFHENGSGNVGPLQIGAPSFKPPTGAGLSIDAGGIVGGGFLDFDDENKRYAGILTLSFGEIGLVAIGLITTRMPDGSEGFSLLVNIGVTFDPPIQLSMGFTLAGVGGLIGVNRSMEIEVLQTGIRNRTLDSILFPEPTTVIANAAKIISDLQAVFPPQDGRFVVGPMVKIAYGTPAIITADIGVFLDLPDPVRVVLMGQVQAAFPEPRNAVVVIHLDVLGVLDFAKQELTFQASLYDSRILVYPVSGDSAFLLGWGDNARFALSLGGFHPRFAAPAPPLVFAGLRRLTIGIGKGGDLQLTCEAYQALTPNSLQFGAAVQLYVSAGDATVTGYLGFDALIYFSPFRFEIDIGAGVNVKYRGHSVAEVRLQLNLAGPGAWSARGKAKVVIDCCPDVEVGFSFEWGDSAAPTLPSVDPWGPLQDALRQPGNWSAAQAPWWSMVEALRDREGETPGPIVVHPTGRIEVSQKVVPLDVTLDKVSNAPVRGHDRFKIELLCGGILLDTEPAEEFFARGQFEDLSDRQRLSVPAFERMPAGVRGLATAVDLDSAIEPAPIAYDSILINDDRISVMQQSAGGVDSELMRPMTRSDAARRAATRGPRERFGTRVGAPKVRCRDERYCVANAYNLTRAAPLAGLSEENRNLTKMAADDRLAAHATLDPQGAAAFIVVPEYEVQEMA